MNISALPCAFNVEPLRAELEAHPEAWDRHRWRTEHPRSPHRECSDIWCRYNAIENYGPRFNDEHEGVWYPVAEQLPSAREISEALSAIRGQKLAGVLLTKVPARKQVYPHIDRGWHAESTDKVGVLIEGNRLQRFCFEGVAHGCEEGECFWFANQAPHWVLNDTDQDRVTLIVCLRRH